MTFDPFNRSSEEAAVILHRFNRSKEEAAVILHRFNRSKEEAAATLDPFDRSKEEAAATFDPFHRSSEEAAFRALEVPACVASASPHVHWCVRVTVATPLHVGRTTIVVQTDVRVDEGKRVALVTQTQAVMVGA